MDVECKHERRKKTGFDRYGTQRYACLQCGKFHTDKTTFNRRGRRLPPEVEEKIASLLADGLSSYAVSRLVGVTHATVKRRAPKLDIKPCSNPAADECDMCGKKIRRHYQRSYFKPSHYARHKFCDRKCYQMYMAAKRSDDCCRICGAKRSDSPKGYMTRGMCTPCYTAMSRFNFDEDAMNAHYALRM